MGNLTVYNQITDRHAPEERGNAGWSDANWPPLSQKGLNPIIDVEDLSMMLMELQSGVLCSYQQCHYTPDAGRNYTIIGTAGRIENFGDVPGEKTVVRLWNRRGDNPKAISSSSFLTRAGAMVGRIRALWLSLYGSCERAVRRIRRRWPGDMRWRPGVRRRLRCGMGPGRWMWRRFRRS